MKHLIVTGMVAIISGNALQAQTTAGGLVVNDPAFYNLIDKDAKVEVLANGFQWYEGPVWVKQGGFLLFSDVKQNTIFKWKEGEGISTFLTPSGYTGRPPYSVEPGSNGLIINKDGELVACEHGDRRVSRMPLQAGGKVTIADNYNSTRFNSPNDIVQKTNGDYYFTDPAYGLPTQKTANVLGVYKVDAKGKVTLLVDDITPNGLAFSPDEKTLYVAQSLPGKAYLFAYDVKEDGTLQNGRLFFDATSLEKQGLQGLPDGLKIDVNGNLFATGPGGIMVVTPAGKLLGRIETGQLTSNCAWGDDGSVLYITANGLLCRIKTKTNGARF